MEIPTLWARRVFRPTVFLASDTALQVPGQALQTTVARSKLTAMRFDGFGVNERATLQP